MFGYDYFAILHGGLLKKNSNALPFRFLSYSLLDLQKRTQALTITIAIRIPFLNRMAS